MSEIRFHASIICNMYQQPECRHYRRLNGVGKWCCYGLPDRPCDNTELRLEALNAAIVHEVRRGRFSEAKYEG